MVAANPDYVGGWTIWDAAGFGAMVPDHPKLVQGTNGDGSFSPYAVNHRGGASVQVLDDYNRPGSGDYYLLAHASGRETVLEPYHYDVDGEHHLITSVAVPIIIDGRTVGVVGLDTALDTLSQRYGAMRPYDSGAVAIISNTGLVVASRGADKLGEPAEALSPALAGIKPRIARGEAFRLDEAAADAIEIFVPITVGETATPWSVLVSLPKAALLAPAHSIFLSVVVAGLALLAGLAAVLTLLVRRVITRPASRLAQAVETVTTGNTSVTVPSTDRGDELGVIARAIDLFRHNLIEMATFQRREVESKAAAEDDKHRTMAALADSFESGVRRVVRAVATAAGTLANSADALALNSETGTREAASVALLTAEASDSVDSVTQAAEQLAASIHEINHQINQNSAVMQAATIEVTRIATIAGSLAEAGSRIGGIVQMISGIAGQTNLLALNATIEAARAGEAGKGFAVVAHEVKLLAGNTAKATADISLQVTEMQAITEDVVRAIGEVGQAINRTGDVTRAVSVAVEHQSAATGQISASSNAPPPEPARSRRPLAGYPSGGRSRRGGGRRADRRASADSRQ